MEARQQMAKNRFDAPPVQIAKDQYVMTLVPQTKASICDVVIVTYNSEKIINSAIESIPCEANIIVVDNNSSDETVKNLSPHNVKLVKNMKNIGFGSACNKGARIGNSPFILFINPDAVLDKNALEALILAAENYQDAAAFNPRITNHNGNQKFRSKTFLQPVFELYMDKFVPSRHLPPNEDCEIKVLSGSAILCRRSAFEQIGGFDENIFLFFEDDDLSLAFIKAGWKLRYVHKAVVLHAGADSTAPEEGLWFLKGFEWSKSQMYVANKHSIRFKRRLTIFSLWIRKIISKSLKRKDKEVFFSGRISGLINKS